jgi:hypothetical protein
MCVCEKSNVTSQNKQIASFCDKRKTPNANKLPFKILVYFAKIACHFITPNALGLTFCSKQNVVSL